MHYIEQFIKEQNEREVLSGHKKIIPEYTDNYMYMFDSYDNEEVDQALIKITDLIRKGFIQFARKVYEKLSDKIREGNNAQKRQNVWNSLVALAIDLDEQESEND